MTETNEPEPAAPAKPREVGRALRASATVILVIAAAFFGTAAATCGYHFVGGDEEEDPEVRTVVRPTADVVVAVRDLARLETAEYHVERVIDLREEQSRAFGLLQTEDAILLVAAGDIRAGIDFTEMRDGDVVVDPDAMTATITLPPPKVLSSGLDNERTFVHSRTTDVLAKRSETLETRARQEAERTLRDAAVSGGILDRARANAERTVETLVRSLGYRRVEIRWRDRE